MVQPDRWMVFLPASDELGALARRAELRSQGIDTDGYQGQHVGSSQTRMRALMLAHVNQLGSFLHPTEGGLDDGLRFAHESHHRAVCTDSRVNVEQADTIDGLYLVGD